MGTPGLASTLGLASSMYPLLCSGRIGAAPIRLRARQRADRPSAYPGFFEHEHRTTLELVVSEDAHRKYRPTGRLEIQRCSSALLLATIKQDLSYTAPGRAEHLGESRRHAPKPQRGLTHVDLAMEKR